MTKTLCLASLVASFALAACGDDSGTSPDLAKSGDMATGGGGNVEGCAAADFVAGTTVSPWNTSLGKKCLKIKVGGSVTWSPTPSSTHPLEATGGDSPNPITNTGTVTFPNAGTFGWHCGVHTSAMHGAILVEP